MTFDGQFLRQLPHRLVFFKAAFSKTFSPPGSELSSYGDEFSFEGNLCDDKTAIFHMTGVDHVTNRQLWIA